MRTRANEKGEGREIKGSDRTRSQLKVKRRVPNLRIAASSVRELASLTHSPPSLSPVIGYGRLPQVTSHFLLARIETIDLLGASTEKESLSRVDKVAEQVAHRAQIRRSKEQQNSRRRENIYIYIYIYIYDMSVNDTRPVPRHYSHELSRHCRGAEVSRPLFFPPCGQTRVARDHPA
jgi:hypothetical protein